MKKEKDLHELEEEGRRKKANDEEMAKLKKASASAEKDRLAILSTSRLASALILPTIFPLSIFLNVFLLSMTFVAHGLGHKLSGKGGHGVMYDPREDQWLPWVSLIFTGVLALYVILRPIAKRRAQSNFQRELEWLKLLPFPVEGYLETLGRSNSNFEFEIYYQKQQVPLESLVDNVFTGLAGSMTGNRIHGDTYHFGSLARGLNGHIRHSRDSGCDKFNIRLKSDYMSGFRCYKLFHKLSETIFRPLHNDYAIRKICVS